jgi:hypothetical protein
MHKSLPAMMMTEYTPEQRRKNARTAWILAGIVAFIFLTSIPFWQGLYRLANNGGL